MSDDNLEIIKKTLQASLEIIFFFEKQNMKKILLLSFVFHLSVNKSEAQTNPKYQSIQIRPDSVVYKMAFITLKIKKIADTFDITLSNTKVVEGWVKPERLLNTSGLQTGDLLCFITNNKYTQKDTILIKQPLNIRYEYPSDNGLIGVKTVILNETEVTLRTGYNPAMKFIQIEAVMASEKTKHIVTLPLK